MQDRKENRVGNLLRRTVFAIAHNVFRESRITTAITQVAANKLKIKTDVKCDLGSSHCYHAVSPWQSVIL